MDRVVERFLAMEGEDEKGGWGDIVRFIAISVSPLGIYIC